MSLFSKRKPADKSLKSQQRNEIRAHIRKASRGHAYSFLHATETYFDLLSEYFYLIGYTDPRDRIFEITNLLTECWCYLPYTRRVSDLERFIQLELEKRQPAEDFSLEEPHSQLVDLKHPERFLLVAREFEEWSYKSLALSLRWKKRELSHELMMLKSRLIDFKPQMLIASEQSLLLQMSEILESEISSKEARKIEQEAARNYHILQFKADWLAYRCELIDLRQRMRLDREQTDLLKDHVIEATKKQPMERPKMADNIVNQISFTRLPTKVYRG